MALGTVRFRGMPRDNRFAEQEVLALGDRAEVIRVYAATVPADMIQLKV
jgi:hypothetical protein